MSSSSQETIASWGSAIATLFSIIGLVQSQPWLVSISVLFLCTSIGALFYARRQRLALNSARISIEGRSIDGLNLSNLTRTVSDTVIVQKVERVVTVQGSNLAINATYTGYSRSDDLRMIEFTISSDAAVPFANLSCAGYDLIADPNERHAIQPMLLGADGAAKKVGVPLLQPVRKEQPFKLRLKCTLPGCMQPGIDYYAAGLSFIQEEIPSSSVRLVFISEMPNWLRTYEIKEGSAALLGELSPVRQRRAIREYEDTAANVPGQSARVYVFDRSAAPRFQRGQPQ